MSRVLVGSDSFAVDGNLTGNWTQFNPNFGNVSATSGDLSKVAPSGANNAAARWNTGTWAADQYSKIKIGTYSGFNNYMEASVLVRGSGVDATHNCYFAYVWGHAGTVGGAYTVVGKIVANVYTELTALSSVGADGWALNDTLELEAEGTTIRLLRNGSPLRTTTDTDIAGSSSTSAGTLGGGSVWEGGTLGAAATFNPSWSRGSNRILGAGTYDS